MKKLMLLLRVGFPSLAGVQGMGALSGKKKARNTLGLSLLVVFALLYMSGVYSFMMMQALAPLNLMALVPFAMMAASSFVTLLTSLFQAPPLLFVFRDHDLLSSMPISRRMLLGSRFIIFYLYNLAFVLLLMLPPLVLYPLATHSLVWWYIPVALVATLAIPALPSSLGALLGVGIKCLTSRFRRSNALNIVAMLAFFLVVMGFSMGLSFLMAQNKMASFAQALTNQYAAIFPPALLWLKALEKGDALSLLAYLALSAAPVALVCLLFSRFFEPLRQKMQTRYSAAAYSMNAVRRLSPLKALFNKEFRRFLSSALYVLNAGVGLLLMVLAAGALLVLGPQRVLAYMGESQAAYDSIVTMLPYILGLMASMTSVSVNSISLEGKSLSILKSMPVEPRIILTAKALVNLVLVLGASFLSGILICLALRPPLIVGLGMFLLPALYGVMASFGGVLLNLALPSLNWTHEVQVIKQSPAVLVAMVLSFATTIPLIILALQHPQSQLMLGLTAAGLALLDLIIWRILTTWGVKKWNALIY